MSSNLLETANETSEKQEEVDNETSKKKGNIDMTKVYPIYDFPIDLLPESKPNPITLLSEAAPQDFISDDDLCKAFERSSSSIQRSIKRGELPQPSRVGNTNYWFAEDLVEHLKKQQKIAQDEHDRLEKAERALLP